jgi:hypothetical protein
MEAVPQLPMIRKIRLDDAYGSADPLVMVNGHRAKKMRFRQSDRVPTAEPTPFEDRSALSEFIGEFGFNRDGIFTEPGFPRTLGQVENVNPY